MNSEFFVDISERKWKEKMFTWDINVVLDFLYKYEHIKLVVYAVSCCHLLVCIDQVGVFFCVASTMNEMEFNLLF